VLLGLSAKEQQVVQDYVRYAEFYPDMYPLLRKVKFPGYGVIPGWRLARLLPPQARRGLYLDFVSGPGQAAVVSRRLADLSYV
jgi:hypothetical protein